MFQSAGAGSLSQERGLTLLEQNFESALAAIVRGYGEGVYQRPRYRVTGRKSCSGKRNQPVRASARRRRRRSFSILPAEVGWGLFAS